MSNTSPHPWHTEHNRINGNTMLVDTNGISVGATWQPENAELIVSAVNERDSLRDLVRRLNHVVQDTLDFAEAMCGVIPDNPERAKARSEIEALLSEARAAIGEDGK